MMKVILIGEEHISSQGPYVLLEILKDLKQKQIRCSIALEIPTMEKMDNLYVLDGITKGYLLFSQLQRKLFLLGAIALFPAFGADLANQEEDITIRDDIMASEILAQSADVVVMLVGALHLEGLSQILKSNGVDVLCFAPKRSFSLNHYPDIIRNVVNGHGFFYSTESDNALNAKKRINKFIDYKETQSDLSSVTHKPQA